MVHLAPGAPSLSFFRPSPTTNPEKERKTNVPCRRRCHTVDAWQPGGETHRRGRELMPMRERCCSVSFKMTSITSTTTQLVLSWTDTSPHLSVLLQLFASRAAATSVTAAVLTRPPHLCGEAVCSNSRNPPPCLRSTQRPHSPPLSDQLLFCVGPCEESCGQGFRPLCQPGGSSIAAWRHKARIDQGGRLMVTAGSPQPESKASFTVRVGWGGGGGQRWQICASPLSVGFGKHCRLNPHIKNQFMQ